MRSLPPATRLTRSGAASSADRHLLVDDLRAAAGPDGEVRVLELGVGLLRRDMGGHVLGETVGPPPVLPRPAGSGSLRPSVNESPSAT